VAALAAAGVRDGRTGLGVPAVRQRPLECHRGAERHPAPPPSRAARGVRGRHTARAREGGLPDPGILLFGRRRLPVFPVYFARPLTFGLNICTELWALETYADYAALGVELLLSPRATAAATTARWLAVGVVAAVRSGGFSLSPNRPAPPGRCGGGGWIIDPAGEVLAVTSAAEPFVTRDI